MKIDADLRTAIRSAEKAQPRQDWNQQDRDKKAAVAELLKKKPEIAKAVNAAIAKLKRAEEAKEEAYVVLKSWGINSSLSIWTEEAFLKAGGKYPRPGTTWKFDQVMALLAAAGTQKEVDTILKKHGIVWR